MERVRLAEARYSEGWSQEKVAESIGVTRNTVSQWERGVTDPHPIYVHRLCQLYKKTAAELDLGGRQGEKVQREDIKIKKSGSDPSLKDTLEDESDPEFQWFSQTIAKSLLQAFADLGIQSTDSFHQQLGKRNMDRSRRLLFQVFSRSVAALLGLSQDTDPEINILQSWDQQVLSNRGKVPERSYCQANTTSVTAQMGVNAVHLHNYVAAITLIEQGMENYNPTLVRGRARLKAQQAEAYYGLGDIRACCQGATEAWLLARAASSNKTFARLRNLQRDLVISPQKKEPEVIDLNWVMTTL